MALCSKGHEQTEENVTWVKRGDRPGMRRRCRDCMNSYTKLKGKPTVNEMSRQATDFLHEDIEDLLNLGATYKEIIDRGGYSNWNNMYKSLKRRGRTDLIERMRAQKVKV